MRPETNESLGRWQLKRRDGSVLEFDSYVAGYGLTRMSDRLGNSVTFVRNAGRITRMLSPSGRYIDFSYREWGQVLHSTIPRPTLQSCPARCASNSPVASTMSPPAVTGAKTFT